MCEEKKNDKDMNNALVYKKCGKRNREEGK